MVQPVASMAAAPSSAEELIASNTLQEDGKVPFHMLMTFQVFDLAGKPSEQGTIEYWWAGPAGSALEIKSPSLGSVHDVRLAQVADRSERRTVYLATELLDDMRFPASSLGHLQGALATDKRSFGKTELECIPAPPPVVNGNAVCVDGVSETIRAITGPSFLITRNRTGRFAGTHVALELAVYWNGKEAIVGHVDKLEGFDPANAPLALTKPRTDVAAASSTKPSAQLAGGVIAGNKIGGAQPFYPETSRRAHSQGAVVLLGNISTDGKILDLLPIASPDELLTESAIDAVKTWTYRPYLLDGTPVAVTTTITVHFALNHN